MTVTLVNQVERAAYELAAMLIGAKILKHGPSSKRTEAKLLRFGIW